MAGRVSGGGVIDMAGTSDRSQVFGGMTAASSTDVRTQVRTTRSRSLLTLTAAPPNQCTDDNAGNHTGDHNDWKPIQFEPFSKRA